MAVAVYTKGSGVELSVAFEDRDGDAADPTTITVSYWKPGAAAAVSKVFGTDVEVVKDSVGNYRMDVSADTEGVWRFRWSGTGAIVAARDSQFRVLATEF